MTTLDERHEWRLQVRMELERAQRWKRLAKRLRSQRNATRVLWARFEAYAKTFNERYRALSAVRLAASTFVEKFESLRDSTEHVEELFVRLRELEGALERASEVGAG